MNDKVKIFFQTYQDLIIAGVSAIIIILTTIFNFTKFLVLKLFFSIRFAYEIDFSIIDSQSNIIYELFLSILIIIIMGFLMFFYEKFRIHKEMIKNLPKLNIENDFYYLKKEKNRYRIYVNISVLVLVLLLLTSNTSDLNAINISSITKIINILAMILFMFIIIKIILWALYLLMLKTNNQIEVKQRDIFISEFIKITFGFLFAIITMTVCVELSQIPIYTNNKTYRLTENEKAILYTTKDYYIIADVSIINDSELIIYKNTIQNVSKLNIKSESIQFEKIKITVLRNSVCKYNLV